jgi:hypothetical protein
MTGSAQAGTHFLQDGPQISSAPLFLKKPNHLYPSTERHLTTPSAKASVLAVCRFLSAHFSANFSAVFIALRQTFFH